MMTVISIDSYLESHSVDFALMHAQSPTKSDFHLCIFVESNLINDLNMLFLNYYFYMVRLKDEGKNGLINLLKD